MTEPLTDERLNEIRERADAATKGPWDWEAADGSLLMLGAANDSAAKVARS